MKICGQAIEHCDIDELVGQLQYNCPHPFNLPTSNTAQTDAPLKSHFIHQGQVGISTTEPLGTKYVGDCITLILRSDLDGKTALAHIDQQTTPESINGLIGSFGNAPIKGVLLGARFTPDGDGHKNSKESSRHNIIKVLSALENSNVDIIAAQIQEGEQPHSIYVDPKTFAIMETMEEYDYPDSPLAYAKMILTGGLDSIPLELTADLTESTQRKPILLRAQETHTLNHYIEGKSDEQIAAWCEKRGLETEPSWISNVIKMCRNWNDIYQETVVKTSINLGIPEDEIRRSPLYVGENAQEYNQKQFKKEVPKDQSPLSLFSRNIS